MIRFGPYRLDPLQGLSMGDGEIRLTPKSIAVLTVLAERPGRIVTKDELFEAVWPDAAVTDSALATCVQEIRKALGDDPRRPTFVETLHRRGYRFIAETVDDERAEPSESKPVASVPIVGREREIDLVLQAYEAARRGARRVLLISGEPGIGKSVLLAEALDRLPDEAVVTWANCVEQYGSGEPYQPLLDALMRLCRRPEGERTIAVLQRYAPMWLAQLPGLLTPRDAAALQLRLVGALRDRMLRELSNAVEALATQAPVVLAIEDVHWSDPSTLDWISSMASRADRARFVLVATLRPSDGDDPGHPLTILRESLAARRLAAEIRLAGLSESEVTEYVVQTLPPVPARRDAMERLATRLHHHTGGNPLFVATVLDQLVERGVVTRAGDSWDTSEDVEGADLGIPETIRPVIDRQIARLATTERRVLESASAVGDRFEVGVVAGVLEIDPDDAETALLQPGSQRLVRPDDDAAAERLPARFAFAHTLFRDALYSSMASFRRADLHRRIAALQERTWGARAGEIAAELALHFELGGDDDRAVHFGQRAGDNARRRSAFREARRHYDHALALLQRLPDDDARAVRELDLQMGLGAATMATAGFGAPQVEAAYSRARDLAHQIGDTPGRFPALFGLWLFYWGRGEVRTADELARELRRRAGSDLDRRLQAAHSSWTTAFSQGDFAGTVRYGGAATRLYDPDRHRAMAATYGGHDPGVCGRMFAGRALAIQGRVDESTRLGDDAVALARTLDHPFSLGLALTFRGAAAQAVGDVGSAEAAVDEAIAIARNEGFRLMLGWCMAVAGWVAVRRGDADRGGELIDEAIATTRATGSDQFLSYLMASRAEAHLAAARPAEALAVVRDGHAAVERTGEQFYEAELHRLEGEALLGDAADAAAAAAAGPALRTAVDVATRQGASLFALRAAIRLAELGGAADARDLVAGARRALPAASTLPEAAAADRLLGPDLSPAGAELPR